MRDMRDDEPPHSIEAEQHLLGAILADNSAAAKVADILKPEHFYDPVHADIYRIALGRITKGHLASPVTMKVAMEGHQGLGQLGGAPYLARLAGAAVSTFAVADYARLVAGEWIKRQVLQITRDAQSGILSAPVAEVIAKMHHSLYALPQADDAESSISLVRAMTDAVMQANEAYQGNARFLATGIPSLDRIIRGLAPGDLMVLGGATSMGKTATALEIAHNVAVGALPVAFVSLEMTPQQLATRLASRNSRVPYSELRDAAQMDEQTFRKWVDGARGLISPTGSPAAMRIIPKHIRDIPAIHAACTRAANEMGKPLSLIVVDYAQLVRGQGKTRYEQMTEVSIGLKTLGGMLDCPVIGLVQLSRDIGFRDDKRPQLSDIKETGQFENDADQVVFCHREEYWLRRSSPKVGKDGTVSMDAIADHEADIKRHSNKMELIVRKNRHGRLATAEVGFHDATNRFWSLEPWNDGEQEPFV